MFEFISSLLIYLYLPTKKNSSYISLLLQKTIIMVFFSILSKQNNIFEN